jgi:membrane protease YdiL (CAAX protease family)
MVAAPFVLGLCFAPWIAYYSGKLGLKDEALMAAITPVAPFPAALGFLGIFALSWKFASGEKLTLARIGWRRPSAADVAIGLAVGLFLGGVNRSVIFPLLMQFQPSFDPSLDGVPWLPARLMLVVAVFAEDTLYRGYAWDRFRGRFGVFPAILVTSFAYALLAPGPELPIKLWAFAFGLFLSLVRLWRNNLWPVAIVHLLVSVPP